MRICLVPVAVAIVRDDPQLVSHGHRQDHRIGRRAAFRHMNGVLWQADPLGHVPCVHVAPVDQVADIGVEPDHRRIALPLQCLQHPGDGCRVGGVVGPVEHVRAINQNPLAWQSQRRRAGPGQPGPQQQPTGGQRRQHRDRGQIRMQRRSGQSGRCGDHRGQGEQGKRRVHSGHSSTWHPDGDATVMGPNFGRRYAPAGRGAKGWLVLSPPSTAMTCPLT